MEEQNRRCDVRCIYEAGKAKGVKIKLKGSNLIIDGPHFAHKDINNLPLSSHTYPSIMEDQEDQEQQQQMDTAPAPPPGIKFGSWAAKHPTEKEKEENNGPTMVSQSHYKPIIGQFPSIS